MVPMEMNWETVMGGPIEPSVISIGTALKTLSCVALPMTTPTILSLRSRSTFPVSNARDQQCTRAVTLFPAALSRDR